MEKKQSFNAFLMSLEPHTRRIIIGRIMTNRLIWAPETPINTRQTILKNWRSGKTTIPYYVQLVVDRIVFGETGQYVFGHNEISKYIQIPA